MVKPGGRIVMVWPVLQAGKDKLPLPLINEVRSHSLELVDMLTKQVPGNWHNNRKTLWYARPDARVIREIVVLQKQ